MFHLLLWQCTAGGWPRLCKMFVCKDVMFWARHNCVGGMSSSSFSSVLLHFFISYIFFLKLKKLLNFSYLQYLFTFVDYQTVFWTPNSCVENWAHIMGTNHLVKNKSVTVLIEIYSLSQSNIFPLQILDFFWWTAKHISELKPPTDPTISGSIFDFLPCFCGPTFVSFFF